MKNYFLGIMFIGLLSFGAGFLVGERFEQNKYDHHLEGTDWEIRWREGVTPPIQPKKDDTRVRVWPFVDVDVKK